VLEAPLRQAQMTLRQMKTELVAERILQDQALKVRLRHVLSTLVAALVAFCSHAPGQVVKSTCARQQVHSHSQ
jgi:hypothetical protein